VDSIRRRNVPFHQIIEDAYYDNEQVIDCYEGILEGFDYETFAKGRRFKGKIPDSVRLYVNKENENLPQASLLGGAMKSWLIFSDRFLDFVWTLIKDDVQVLKAPVYRRSDGSKINGYKIVNPLRVIDCIDWEQTHADRNADGSIKYVLGTKYIREKAVGNHHIFRMKYWLGPVIVSDTFAKSLIGKGFKGIAFIRCGVSK